ncbi:hypothetical protein AB0K05_27550 [Nonomuraea sp. NPDC049486]|uniref:hypothetical protein n=1 Tax=Nonomuraea sp. NPDC049486 TaxID=3155773 RepID=UPI0034147F41
MPEAVQEAPARHVQAMTVARRDGVIWRAYGTAARHLIRLAAPAALVFLPISLVALLGLALVVDESAVLVDGSFELLGTPGRPLLVWAAAVMLASLAGQAVVLPATVVIAVGLLTGRPVATPDAMRAALRNLPAMLLLALLGVVVFTATAVAGFGMLMWTGQLLWAVLVMASLAVLALPSLLAVAIVTLEGRSAGRALAGAYRLAGRGEPTAGGFWSCTLTLAFGVLVFPAAAQRAVEWAVEWAVSGSVLGYGVATSALTLVIPAFQATVIARLYLSRLAHRSTAEAFERVVEKLPGSGAASPARPVPVLAALLLPGSLFAATLLVNPFGWLEVTQTVVTATWTSDDVPPQPRPGLRETDLKAMYAGRGDELIMFMDSFGLARLLTCSATGCPRTGFRWAEPADADEDIASSSARLHEGRIAVSTWSQRGQGDDRRVRLGLMLCDARGCVPGPRPIGEEMSVYEGRSVALAPGRYDGLMIAQVRELPERDGEVLSVTFCEDPVCADPWTKELARLPSRTSAYQEHGLVVGAGPTNRPVVLRFDEHAGSLALITCEESDCAEVHVERLVHGGWTWGFDEVGGEAGATMVVRDDGRPLIAYRDSADGSIRMLDCRNLSCSQSDPVILAGPGRFRVPPALVVDGEGRALVAYQDVDDNRIVVATCEGTRCTHTPVAKGRYALGDALAMTLDARGRPMIGWIDHSEHDWDLILTTPLNLPS